MTYQELLEELNELTTDQLQQHVTVFSTESSEYIDLSRVHTQGESDDEDNDFFKVLYDELDEGDVVLMSS